MGQKLDAPLPKAVVETGPVQEIVLEGPAADLALLPIPRHFEQDAGPYVTAGMIAARDPDTGTGNLAYVRLQAKGPRRMGASLHSRQHTWDYLRPPTRGQDLPAAVVIGAHPAVMLAGAARLAIDQDEYDVAGALLGRPLPVVAAGPSTFTSPRTRRSCSKGTCWPTCMKPRAPSVSTPAT